MWQLKRGHVFLSYVSVQRLQKMYVREQNAKAKLRLLAAIRRKKGESLDDIASALEKPRRTIHGWLTRFEQRRLKAVYDKKQPGRKPKLATSQLRKLRRDLIRGPPHVPGRLWTTKIVGEHIRRKYGIVYKYDNVYRLLCALGFTVQKPRPQHYKSDKDVQARFKKKAHRVAQLYRNRGWTIGCLDECSINIAPYLSRGWALKGSRPVVKTNFTRERFHIIGARTKRKFVFRFIMRQTQRTFIKFVRVMLKEHPRLVLFVDNAPWHRSKAVKQFCRKRSKTLRLRNFPAYSPELNIVEQHWKVAKQAISNRVLRTLPAAQYHLRTTFNNSKAMPKMFKYLRD